MGVNLEGKVCLVTGGTRGIGSGIALQLGEAGATVYVTGRTKQRLESVCSEIKERGGRGIPVQVDHSKPEEVRELFEKIKSEQNGRLDVLVNNAFSAIEEIFRENERKFWDANSPVDEWDSVNNVGLRNHYVCAAFAAKMMVRRGSGLIVNISSFGGIKYTFNAAYGVGKSGMDRMAQDCGIELKPKNVAMVALWPGPVQTEIVQNIVLDKAEVLQDEKSAFVYGESIGFTGKAVAHLAADPNVLNKTGRVLIVGDLAREYGFRDFNGKITGDFRNIKWMMEYYGYPRLAAFIPSFLHIPRFVLFMLSYKF